MPRFYDRNGHKISTGKYLSLIGDPEYAKVGHDEIGDYVVSTIWIGHNLSPYSGIAPLIFETMVIGPCEYVDRYATEADALIGHAHAVAYVRAEINRRHPRRPAYNVLILDDGEIGYDARVIGPYPDFDAALAGADDMRHYATTHGYREEGVDFEIFAGVELSDPANLDRSPKGATG